MVLGGGGSMVLANSGRGYVPKPGRLMEPDFGALDRHARALRDEALPAAATLEVSVLRAEGWTAGWGAKSGQLGDRTVGQHEGGGGAADGAARCGDAGGPGRDTPSPAADSAAATTTTPTYQHHYHHPHYHPH